MYRFVRWLLVAVLPFMGLYLGSRLKPELKPLWEVSFPEMMVYLGQVDEGRTILLSERGTTISKDKELTIVGIDATTGNKLFRHALPEETRLTRDRSSHPLTLTSDGNYITFYDHDGKRNTNIVLYDWRQQKIVRRFRCQPEYVNKVDPVIQKKTLVAPAWNVDAVSKVGRSFLVVWDIDRELPKWNIEVGQQFGSCCLSEDGTVVVIENSTTNLDELVVVDLLQGTIIQKIPGHTQFVRWSSDDQHMHIVKQEKSGVYIQHYDRQNGQYVATTRDLIAQSPADVLYHNNLIGLRRYVGSSPFRSKLQGIFNTQLNAVLDQLWPVSCVVSLYEPETGEMVRSMAMPCSLGPTIPTNNLEGVIIPNGKSLTYWPFTSVSTWPQWLGLLFGVLLASLLAWSNLRRSPRKAN